MHGHYSNIFEEEVNRIKKLFKEKLSIDITWTEATAIAAKRSSAVFLDMKDLKKMLSELRGLR